jgi:hypothetical protein
MYIFLTLLFSLSAFAQKDLAFSNKWLRLLHYKKTFLGTYESQADGMGFFLTKNGKTDPEGELKAAIEQFGSTLVPDDDHPICKFPLRYKWLNEQLGRPWKADLMGCKSYVDFFSKLAAKRASIVFSSYYLSNPNTAFGHTLMRFSRFEDKNETEMLDYGINYSAQVDTDNLLVYGVKGIFGGFKGEFAAIPYYYKIREYSDMEFRDLWSYDLKLSVPQILEMIDHIWELGSTDFDYYYFQENCSYHLLTILEVALPEKKLTDHYQLFAIPADTVRLLQREGLIEEGKRRESTYSRLVRKSRRLNSKELELSRKIAENSKDTKKLIGNDSSDSAANVLDVALEAFDYFNAEKILKDHPETKEAKHHILKARATHPKITEDDSTLTNKYDSPALGHAPTKLSLFENYTNREGKATRFEIRSSLHDLLDPPQGTLKEAQLEMARISIELKDKYYTDQKLILDQFAVFSIRNYPEQNFWASPFSWEAEGGLKQMKRWGCFDCPGGYLSLSAGNSVTILNERILLSVLLNGEVNVQSQFENNYRVGLGPKIYTRFKFNDRWLIGVNSWYHFNTYEHDKVFQDYEWSNDLELRHHLSEKISLSLKGGGVERDREWQIFGEFGVQYFYE